MVDTIFINGKFLSSPVTGVQRYALELFRKIDIILQEPAYRSVRLICLAPRKILKVPGWHQIELRQVGFNSGNLWEQLDLPVYAYGRLLFSPANTGPLFFHNQIITLHDAAVFAVPETYSYFFCVKYFILFKVLIRIARLFLTNSDFSQRELSHYLDVPRDRFKVILLGSDHLRDTLPDVNILQKHGLTPKSYFLCVASQNPRKNLGFVLQALQQIESGVEFVVAGGSFTQIYQKTESWYQGAKNVHRLGYVNDGELKALYENAIGFIFPSIYEGFGLPILEAMSSGCPVLCSDIAVMREVGGQAAQYFDPYSVEAIVAVIREFLARKSLITDLQTRGYERVASFSWEKTARETLNELVACL